MEEVRVGVIMGGSSSEREISLRSGEAVAQALEAEGHEVVRIELGSGLDAVDALVQAEIDVAFLALHGKQGEDGCVQGLLEMLGIPYTGSGVLASALAMDKLRSKELFRLHNVPTPAYYTVQKQQAALLEETHGFFGFPVIVKPRREGSSVGLTKANNLVELRQAVETALLFDDSVLVERFIQGREITVAILNGRVLGALEIAHKAELFDFQAKYESQQTEYFCPARLEPARLQGILNLAQHTADAFDLRGAARIDILATDSMNEYVLEVNTLPGMTETSLLPQIAAHAGYPFAALCEAILSSARLDSGLGMETVRRFVAEKQDENVWQEANVEEWGGDSALVMRSTGARAAQKSA